MISCSFCRFFCPRVSVFQPVLCSDDSECNGQTCGVHPQRWADGSYKGGVEQGSCGKHVAWVRGKGAWLSVVGSCWLVTAVVNWTAAETVINTAVLIEQSYRSVRWCFHAFIRVSSIVVIVRLVLRCLFTRSEWMSCTCVALYCLRYSPCCIARYRSSSINNSLSDSCVVILRLAVVLVSPDRSVRVLLWMRPKDRSLPRPWTFFTWLQDKKSARATSEMRKLGIYIEKTCMHTPHNICRDCINSALWYFLSYAYILTDTAYYFGGP